MSSEVGVDAHVVGTARFVVGGRARAGDVDRAGNRVAHVLRVTGAELAFVEQVIDAGGDADVFGQVIGRAGADDGIRADLAGFAAGGRFTTVVVLLRLLTAVPVRVDCIDRSCVACQLRVELTVNFGITDR